MGHKTNTGTERKTTGKPWLALAATALLLMAPGAVAQDATLDAEGTAHAEAHADASVDVDTSVVSDVQGRAEGTVHGSTELVSETQQEIDSTVRGTVSAVLQAEAEARAEAEGQAESSVQAILDARAEAEAEARAQTEVALEAQAEARAEAQAQVLVAYELVGAVQEEAEGEISGTLDTLVFLESQTSTSASAHAGGHIDGQAAIDAIGQACAAASANGGASFLTEVAGGPLYATDAGNLVGSAELGRLCAELGHSLEGSVSLDAEADAHAEAETGFFAQVRSVWNGFISLF